MNHLYTQMLIATTALFIACTKDNPESLVASKATSSRQTEKIAPPLRRIAVQSPGQNQDIQPNILAALSTAIDGDQLDLPEGSFVLNGTITINKMVSLRGIGGTRTILYRSETIPDATLTNEWGGMFTFDINKATTSNILVYNIYFKSKKPSVTDGDGGSLATDYGIRFKNCVDFVVQNCKFAYFGSTAIGVYHDDNISRGLIYKNEFIHNMKGSTGQGLGYGISVYGANKEWTASPQFGTDNFIFVENNNFDFHRHSIAAGGCGRYVFRYNTVSNNLFAHAVDMHEARRIPGTNYYSTRAAEIYNNTIINTTFKDGTPITEGQSAKLLTETAIAIKGGEALVHDNKIQGYRFGIGVQNSSATATQTYPIFTQVGYASGLALGENHSGSDSPQNDGDLFLWNNAFSPYAGTVSSSAFYNYQPIFFKELRDYHHIAKPGYTSFIYPHPRRA